MPATASTTVHICPALLLVAGTALFSFWPSLDADFAFDDAEAIVSNPDVSMARSWYSAFANDFWGNLLSSPTSHKSYRPLTVLTFRFNYNLAGSELRPREFHATNLGLYVLCCLVLLFAYNCFIRTLWRDGHGRRNQQRHVLGRVSSVSLFAALLFAAQPVHAENVAGIVGRADILCAICFFLAFLAYEKGSRKDYQENYERQHGICTSLLFFVVCALMAAAGMLFKEQGVTTLGFCLIYDFLTATDRWLPSFLRRSAFLFSTASVTLVFRWWIMGATNPQFQKMDNPGSFAESWWQRTANYNYVYALNAWILLNPSWLCYDWSMGCIPLIEKLNDGRLLAIAVLWIVIVALSSSCFRDFARQKTTAVALSLVAVSFLPASNVLFRVGFVVAERVLFLPSSGFCLLVAVGYSRLLNTFVKQQRIIKFLGAACLLLFMLRSRQRSIDWLSEVNLFRSGLKVCPLNAKVHYNVAKKAADGGNLEAAVQEYTEALRLFPRYDQAMNNLANILKDRGQLSQAEDLLSFAVDIRPDFAAAWMNLGIVQSSLRKYDVAEQSYLTALSHRKQYPDCYYNLGNLYLDQKRYNDAYQSWRNATSLKPTHSVSWNNMIIMFDNQGDYNRAKSTAKEALGFLPHESSIHFNLANVLGKLGEFSQSEHHFLIAIHISPDNSSYFTNLGVLYHRWKLYDKAEEAYRHALRLDSLGHSAKDNLERLLEMRRTNAVSPLSRQLN